MPKQTLIITGASGDLTKRFLLPSLGRLLDAQPDRSLKLIGSARRDESNWSGLVKKGFAGYAGPAMDATLAGTEWITADATSAEDWARLLAAAEGETSIYFALGPDVTSKAIDALATLELPAGLRLVLEKPFGTDTRSARELNRRLADLVDESQIFRVDHFLASPAVLSMDALRFGNRVTAALWNAEHISSVNVVWDEAVGLAGRAGFYDKTGAMEDMIQSHLLQVLAATIMERPTDAAGKPDSLAAALDSLQLVDGPQAARRARWTAGEIAGEQAIGYADEEGVDPELETETLAQVVMSSSLPDWHGVPLLMRSGKGQGRNRRYIDVIFKPVAELPGTVSGEVAANRLRIQILTGMVSVHLMTADPNSPTEFESVRLSGGSYQPAGTDPDDDPAEVIEAAEAAVYARVLEAALDADDALAVSAAAAERCWQLVAPVARAYETGEAPLEEYPAGTMGPAGWVQIP